MPPIAIGIGAAVSGIAGGLLANQGAQAQARAAEQSSAAAIAEQRRQFDITRQTLQPWVSAGGAAVSRLAFLLGIGPTGQEAPAATGGGGGAVPNVPISGGPGQGIVGSDGIVRRWGPIAGDEFPSSLRASQFLEGGQPGTTSGTPPPPPGDYGSLMRDFSLADFEQDPGYAFRVSEGMKALERSAAARGSLFGGGTLRALTRYGQDMGSQEYLNAYNRFQQNRLTRYNMLAGVAGLGQTSAGQLVSAGQQTAGNIGNFLVGGATAAGAARASGYGALGAGIANAPLNFWQLYQLSQRS